MRFQQHFLFKEYVNGDSGFLKFNDAVIDIITFNKFFMCTKWISMYI